MIWCHCENFQLCLSSIPLVDCQDAVLVIHLSQTSNIWYQSMPPAHVNTSQVSISISWCKCATKRFLIYSRFVWNFNDSKINCANHITIYSTSCLSKSLHTPTHSSHTCTSLVPLSPCTPTHAPPTHRAGRDTPRFQCSSGL